MEITMKNSRSLALILAATIGLSAGIAPAFAEHGGPHHGGPHGGHGGPGRFFDEADANKDGFLTKDEMKAAQDKKLDQMFTNVDKNKDGKLSKEELEQGRKEMFNKMRERMKERKGDKKSAE
jgi:EF-hand domain pair